MHKKPGLGLKARFAGIAGRAAYLFVAVLVVTSTTACYSEPKEVVTNLGQAPSTDLQYCVVCGHESQFEPFGTGTEIRGNAMCPHCGSLERHRLLRLFIASRSLIRPGMRVLHISPQPALESVFGGFSGVEYQTSEIEGGSADFHFDLTSIELPDDSIDAFLCLHVLEHIEDDRRAMREIFRVLKPGGWAILQVPLYRDRPLTFEDPSITSPVERETAFGQFDHVRVYGWQDFRDRLMESGFDLQVEDFVADFDTDTQKRMGLDKEEWIHICRKLL